MKALRRASMTFSHSKFHHDGRIFLRFDLLWDLVMGCCLDEDSRTLNISCMRLSNWFNGVLYWSIWKQCGSMYFDTTGIYFGRLGKRFIVGARTGWFWVRLGNGHYHIDRHARPIPKLEPNWGKKLLGLGYSRYGSWSNNVCSSHRLKA